MYSSVSMGAIGVRVVALDEQIKQAGSAGFLGINLDIRDVADLIRRDGAASVRELFANSRIVPGGWGLPNGWNGPEADWEQVINEMPRLAHAAADVGADRATTWLWSGSDERTFNENVVFHVRRLRPIAEILASHEIRLGLEFLGPKTLQNRFRHPFISTSDDMLALCRQIGLNVGLLLDCWHWYTSHGTVNDLQAMTNRDVVVVHVNDAPP